MDDLKSHILKTNQELIGTINEGIKIMQVGYIKSLDDSETRKLYLKAIESGKEAFEVLK